MYTNKNLYKILQKQYLWSKKINDNLVHNQQSEDIKYKKKWHTRRAQMTHILTTTQLPYLRPFERLSLSSFSNFTIWSR